MTIRTATGLIAAYMRLFGFKGWASFWSTVYILPGFEHDRKDEIILPTSACCSLSNTCTGYAGTDTKNAPTKSRTNSLRSF